MGAIALLTTNRRLQQPSIGASGAARMESANNKNGREPRRIKTQEPQLQGLRERLPKMSGEELIQFAKDVR